MADSWLRPGALVRFGIAVDDGTGTGRIEWDPIFTGTIETMPETTVENVDAYVTLNLVETTAALAGEVAEALEDPIGEGDDLTERVTRLADATDWQAPITVVEDPVGVLATYQGTTLSDTRLSEIGKTVDAVGMIAIAAGDGGLVITTHNPAQDAHATEVFSNAAGFGFYPVVEVTPYASTDRIVNSAVAQRAGAPNQVGSVDFASRDRYGPHAAPGSPLTDLPVLDDDVLVAKTARQVAEGADDYIGIEGVQLDTDQDPARYPRLLARYASSALTARTPFNLVWFHPSGAVFPIQLVVAGYSMGLTMEGAQAKWTATLSTARRYVPPSSDNWDVAYWDDGGTWAFVP